MGEHLGDIRREVDTPISRHVREIHSGDPHYLIFHGIDVVTAPLRGGDWDRLLLQKESQWIFHLRSIHPEGLNETLNFTCFI